MVQVRSVLSSFTFKMEDLKRWRTGFTKETLTYFSLESASVNSNRGLKDLFMASRTSVSCQVGMRCLAFLSLDKTWEIALCCYRTRAIIACLDPHLYSPIARWSLWPKHWSQVQLFREAAFTTLAPLSVVMQTSRSSCKLQEAIASLRPWAIDFPVWSCGKKDVCKHRLCIAKSSSM